mmetsp:Transcript_1962/g.4367  ORF Transcript_1962/g.4367 Transcript_1962/m.4367 type:complete len:235 (-) Transcript_1962:4574-5278(-)
METRSQRKQEGSQPRASATLKPSAPVDAKIPKSKAKVVVASYLQQSAASLKKPRKVPAVGSPYSSQANLSHLKKSISKYNPSSPEQGLTSGSESFKHLNKTFAIPKGDCTDSSDGVSKASLLNPGRSFLSDTKRKPTANEKSLQSKLDSIKSIEFNMYKEVFSETLNQMTTYREVLEEVKQGYDSRIASLEESNSDNLQQIDRLHQAIEDEKRDNIVFQKRLKKLAQENYQLSV